MVTRYTVVQDGQVYEPGDDVPDMGSITALESKGNYREYNALSKDIDKLPTYVSLGSSCYMIDTTDLYKFDGYEPVKIPSDIERIDAQVTYTAMMTNTLLTEE